MKRVFRWWMSGSTGDKKTPEPYKESLLPQCSRIQQLCPMQYPHDDHPCADYLENCPIMAEEQMAIGGAQ